MELVRFVLEGVLDNGCLKEMNHLLYLSSRW